MLYLGWFDDSKTPVVEKIAAGAAAYLARVGTPATVCLCNEADCGQLVEIGGMLIKSDATVSKNNFWIGVDGEENEDAKKT